MGLHNNLLVGQIALERKLVTPEQLRECLELQAGQVQPRPVGTLLVETGALTAGQLDEIIEEQRRRLHENAAYAPATREEISFGRILVSGGYAKTEHVNEALRAQQDLADRGIRKRLGELLVAAGHITPEAVLEILRKQGKILMACTFCGSHFNVLREVAEQQVCRLCSMPLRSQVASISAIETAALLPAIVGVELPQENPSTPPPPPSPSVFPAPAPQAGSPYILAALLAAAAIALLAALFYRKLLEF